MVELESRGKNTEEEEEEDNVGINLADLALYTPGKKISIPLTLPNHHMTGPCYRDLRKHIISKDGWDVKRVAATPEQRCTVLVLCFGVVYLDLDDDVLLLVSDLLPDCFDLLLLYLRLAGVLSLDDGWWNWSQEVY